MNAILPLFLRRRTAANVVKRTAENALKCSAKTLCARLNLFSHSKEFPFIKGKEGRKACFFIKNVVQ